MINNISLVHGIIGIVSFVIFICLITGNVLNTIPKALIGTIVFLVISFGNDYVASHYATKAIKDEGGVQVDAYNQYGDKVHDYVIPDQPAKD